MKRMQLLAAAIVLTSSGTLLAADKADEEFVAKAAQCGMAEVKLGQMATERAANADVKKFGQRMVDDHTKANKELVRVADQKKIVVPSELDKKHQGVIDELAKLKGADFDRVYLQHMVKGHTEAVQLFENQAKNGRDAELKTFAANTLPTIKEHLEHVKKLAGSER